MTYPINLLILPYHYLVNRTIVYFLNLVCLIYFLFILNLNFKYVIDLCIFILKYDNFIGKLTNIIKFYLLLFVIDLHLLNVCGLIIVKSVFFSF